MTRRGGRHGFSIVELLVVLAVIGILSAILIPSALSVRTRARQAKVKVQFAQWTAAMEQFRREYGFYPDLWGESALLDAERFAGALTGRRLNGQPFADANDPHLCGNARQLSFYALSDDELSADRSGLCDAFGNTEFAVLWDKNGDGLIDHQDGDITPVRSGDGEGPFSPSLQSLDLSVGVRAGVIFYSAGKGGGADDLVLSWK